MGALSTAASTWAGMHGAEEKGGRHVFWAPWLGSGETKKGSWILAVFSVFADAKEKDLELAPSSDAEFISC